MTATITSYIALLRGINLGGRNKVPMATLRELVAAHRRLAGAHPPAERQRGLHARRARRRALASDLEQALAAELGLDLSVLMRTGADLRRVVAANPFAMEGIDGSRFVVVFLSGPAPLDRLAAIDAAVYAPDEFRAGEQEIYAHFPDGLHASKLAALFTDRKLGLTASARNWNTVTKLLALSEEDR